MSLQPSKSDQDFTKILIANQDVLFSPTIEQQNDPALEFFQFMSTDTMLNLIDQSNVNTITTSTSSINNQIQTDILDANLFEILKADDPEIVSLLESIDKSDLQIGFLPQISVNTASKVLDDQTELDPVIKLETEPQYQTIQLKSEMPDEVLANQTRISQRLLSKKEKKPKSDSSSKSRNSTKIPKVKTENNRSNLKRKRSVDDDEDSNYNSSENDSVDFNSSQSSNTSNNNKYMMVKHNDNSVDFESDDHIYYDDDDDEDDEDEHENGYYDEDDDQEKEFKNYVRNYSITSRNRNKKLDPTKKESNKEAATRYRLKKLSEKERLFETRMCLENENSEVKRKIEITQTEINYLKNLLVQMLLTKGCLNKL